MQHVHIAKKKREREREIQSKRKKASAPIKQNFPRPLTTRKHQINSVYDTDYHPLAPGEEGGGNSRQFGRNNRDATGRGRGAGRGSADPRGVAADQGMCNALLTLPHTLNSPLFPSDNKDWFPFPRTKEVIKPANYIIMIRKYHEGRPMCIAPAIATWQCLTSLIIIKLFNTHRKPAHTA